MNFFETQAGYNFVTHTVPALVKSIDNLTAALKEAASCKQATQYPVCPACVDFNDGQYSENCNQCITHECGGYRFKNPTALRE